jgi:phosphoenolpyruvate carboxykinase (GTP)
MSVHVVEWEVPMESLFRQFSLVDVAPAFVPLVYQSFNWQHGVFLGATMASETTAAATGALVRSTRSDGDASVLRLQHG